MKKSPHHALVLEGAGSNAVTWAKEYIKENFNLSSEANPDVQFIVQERFTIDEARTLKERASQSPLGPIQVFVIVSERILREAQNALLKLLEEPALHTHFILIVPSVTGLLSTVRSRVTYGGRLLENLQEETFAKTFAEATIGERIQMLEPLIQSKNRVRARNVMDALEVYLHKQGVLEKRQALREITFVKNYLTDTSSSLKMLLEHIAYTI
jgi:hypothetical protein